MQEFYFYFSNINNSKNHPSKMERNLQINLEKFNTFDYDQVLPIETKFNDLEANGIIIYKKEPDISGKIVSYDDICEANLRTISFRHRTNANIVNRPMFFDLNRAVDLYGDSFIDEIIQFVVVTKLRAIIDQLESVQDYIRKTTDNSNLELNMMVDLECLKKIRFDEEDEFPVRNSESDENEDSAWMMVLDAKEANGLCYDDGDSDCYLYEEPDDLNKLAVYLIRKWFRSLFYNVYDYGELYN